MKNFKAILTQVDKPDLPFIGYFETEQEAQEWLYKQKLKVGKRPERVVSEPVLDENGEYTYIETPRVDENGDPVYRVQYTYDEEGNVTSETITDEQIIDYEVIYQDVTYPAEATYEIIDKTILAQRKEKIQTLNSLPQNQSQAREYCHKIIDLMGKKNVDKNLTTEQKDSLMSDASVVQILTMLQSGRPGKAKSLIEAYTPDETTITTQDKNEIIDLLDAILAEYY